MRILIADDEKDIIEFLQDFLEKRGHFVDTALDGGIASDLIKENSYDLVFLDHNMPELTGLELAKLVKKNNPKTKTVMVTGYPSMKDFFAKSVGIDEYISKPCRLEEIKNIVDKYS